MHIHVAVRAGSVEVVAGTLAATATLTEGICATVIGGVSDAFACGADVCAVARVSTRMEPGDLLDWFGVAAREATAGGPLPSVTVLVAEDMEERGAGPWIPSPLIAAGDAIVAPLLDLDPDVRMPDGRRVADVASPPRLARLGPVPGFERDAAPPPPPTHTPVEGTPTWNDAFAWGASDADWVPVTAGWGWHKDIEIKLALLLDAGIPACLHDRPFGDLFAWFWGQVVPTAILVAPEALKDARGVLSAAFVDEDGVFEAAGPELEALRHEPPYRRVRAFLWLYVVCAFTIYALFPLIAGVVLVAVVERWRDRRD